MTTFKTIAIIFLSVLFAATADVCNPSPCGASSCCADTLRGAMCYDKNIYQCAKDDNNGGNYLCSSSSRACNGVCYDATTYVCNSNGIAPKPKNTPTPTTSTTQSPTPTPTSSASAAVCPSWLTACGGACFRASDYCCVDGSLVKSSECKASKTSSTTSSSTTSTTKATTSSNAATSSTTKAATSSTTSSTTSTTSSKATTSAPVVINPTPAPVSSSNSQICNGQAYDSNLFGCSVVGKTESLCPAVRPTSPSKFWIEDITHNGMAAFNQNPSTYQVYRNVKSYGAKGDGVTDDTVAINAAITAFGRCGEGCDSSTVKPALVYFPQGTYRVSGPIIQYYMTQLVGDAVNPPTISALPNFAGMAIIDANPYGNTGNNWYTNQNNFYRQIRNFVIDTTATDSAKATTGIHWQVAQATSLLNIVFRMSTASNTNHQGIWMENGSGSFYSDLVFYGGKFGMWVGNQQFTVRNLTFYNAQTAVYMNWNWGWSFKSLHISGCKVGFDMSSTGGLGQQVGSINLLDAFFENTDTAIITSTTANTTPKSSGTLTLNNVRFSNVPKAVATPTGQVILAGKTGDTLVVPSWLQGYVVDANGRSSFVQGYQTAPTKPSALLDESSSMGYYFERQRPQYQKYAVSDFVNIKSLGAKGDGKSDDTAVIAAALLKYAGCKIVYFPSGTYLIKSTVFVPAGTRIVGEVWSQLMASGSAFSNEYNPTPMLRVGNPGDSGVAELSDLLFTAQGALPGAVLVEWNIKDPVGQKGVSGMWDCHIRIGGALGTGQQVPDCPKVGPTAKCQGIFLMVHLTPSASAYIENMWAWTADHDLDGNGQVSIFSARGVLIESQTALWLYGTASEHNVMYQYQMHNAKNVLGVYFQTETPYFQGSPQAPVPFHYNAVYNDPDYSTCTNTDRCGMAWGLRAIGTTSNVYIYGAGHYNFFDSYDQTCLDTEDCQDTMTDLSIPSGSKFYLYGLNTKAAITMVQSFGKKMAAAMDFRSTFCSTIHYMAAV